MPTSPDLTLSSDYFTISVSRRLLLKITTCNCEASKICIVCNKSVGCGVDEWGDHSLLCMKDSNAGRRVDWHDENYRVWLRMFKRVGWDAKAEVSNHLLCDSNKRPDIVIFKSLAGGDIVIDYITCVVGKSDVVELAATTPLHAADAGATTKCNNWVHLVQLVQLQGDTFLPLAVEDTGALHEEAVDLLASAASATGSTAGERQAFLTYWRQTMAITTARGVAKVIKSRVPACTGAHWPVQPHHFQHVQDAVAPPQPRQHLPMRQPQVCVPCGRNQPVADPDVRVGDYPDTPDFPDCALAPWGTPDSPDCAFAAQGVQHLPDSPVARGALYTDDGGAFAGGRASD